VFDVYATTCLRTQNDGKESVLRITLQLALVSK
jgi:hypothetical protein